MVEPQPIDAAISHKADHIRMDVVEHLRLLNPETDEVGDLEKATVSEHLARCPPVGETPHLPLVQRMQCAPVRFRFVQCARDQRGRRRLSRGHRERSLERQRRLGPGFCKLPSQIGKSSTCSTAQDLRIGRWRQRQL